MGEGLEQLRRKLELERDVAERKAKELAELRKKKEDIEKLKREIKQLKSSGTYNRAAKSLGRGICKVGKILGRGLRNMAENMEAQERRERMLEMQRRKRLGNVRRIKSKISKAKSKKRR